MTLMQTMLGAGSSSKVPSGVVLDGLQMYLDTTSSDIISFFWRDPDLPPYLFLEGLFTSFCFW